jgi:hypothetical protein
MVVPLILPFLVCLVLPHVEFNRAAIRQPDFTDGRRVRGTACGIINIALRRPCPPKVSFTASPLASGSQDAFPTITFRIFEYDILFAMFPRLVPNKDFEQVPPRHDVVVVPAVQSSFPPGRLGYRHVPHFIRQFLSLYRKKQGAPKSFVFLTSLFEGICTVVYS